MRAGLRCNLVVPSLVAITAATMAGMLFTSLGRISTGMCRHSSCNMVQLDNGSWPHVSAATMQWYADNNVHRLDWPAQSPDLNPIEHLWFDLDRQLRSREMRPTSFVQLSAMLQEKWRRILVDILHKLVESMPERMAAVIATRVVPQGSKGAKTMPNYFLVDINDYLVLTVADNVRLGQASPLSYPKGCSESNGMICNGKDRKVEGHVKLGWKEFQRLWKMEKWKTVNGQMEKGGIGKEETTAKSRET
ncbi:hypothetical protein ANN_15800 [Periplaneta americana]|uniref:Tc1-like transposase DDE domain-containing protein n=1 Tax=Periplaneta americana TaxID=6978 RepID=A0ABQ8SH86_PERAM|nr:hypothetical protein ANN_15800 [Periplaneta americana]